MRRFGLSALLALCACGCASVNPGPSFVDVAGRVEGQAGVSPMWARTSEEGAQVERIVQELLEGDLTVGAAVRIALVNNRGLQASFEEIGISQADLVQAGLLKNPGFDGFLRFPTAGPGVSNIEIGLVQDILDILTRPLRKKLGAAQLEQTKLRVGDDVLRLVAEVKTAYFTLQARRQLAERLALIAEINRAAADFAQEQHDAGTLNDLDLANQVALYSQSRVDLALERTQVRADREKLNRLLGLWGRDTDWTIPDQLPEIPDEDIPLQGLESLALTQRLDIAAARWGVDLVGRALALKKGTRYFPVGVDVGVQAERDSDGQWVVGPSLSLQLPIFDTGKASIARLEAQHRQSQRQLEALAIDARSEVREARDLVLATRELVRYYGQVLLPQRARILDLTLQRHNMMLKGAYDLLLARQGEVTTERAYVEAWRDYWIARTQLERAVGGSMATATQGGSQ